MTNTAIPVSGLEVSPAGAYAGTNRPATGWEADYGDHPAHWGARFLDPTVTAVERL